MSNEVVAVDRWLYTTLTGDATVSGIVGTKAFGHFVPEAQGGSAIAPPYVLWTMPGAGNDVNTLNGVRIWADMLYAVRLVAKVEGFLSLEAGAAAIDAALHRASGSNVSGTIVACVREAPFAMPEIENDGAQLWHLGGLYRLNVQ